MLILQDPVISETIACPYLSGKLCRYRYFFALDLTAGELNEVLSHGWRKFGCYFFRPSCGDCVSCTPLRVSVQEFAPSKSQRRVIRKNLGIEVKFAPLRCSGEIYEIYGEHSRTRFDMESSFEDFRRNFYEQSCPSLQSEYYLRGRLIAVGFLDITDEALSTVYFIYRDEYRPNSPGIYSILREIEYARSLDLKYYYLGYSVDGNSRMSYKNSFYPHEKYLWDEGIWVNG